MMKLDDEFCTQSDTKNLEECESIKGEKLKALVDVSELNKKYGIYYIRDDDSIYEDAFRETMDKIKEKLDKIELNYEAIFSLIGLLKTPLFDDLIGVEGGIAVGILDRANSSHRRNYLRNTLYCIQHFEQLSRNQVISLHNSRKLL